VPVEKNGINGHLRQKGKQAELACIAEGQLVLTDIGLVPIEKVTKKHKLWDGEDWVTHDGIVFRGKKEVIEYEGLIATPDHLVWVEGKPEPIPLGIAATSGTHLIQTGDGQRAIRLGENYKAREKVEQEVESYQRQARLYDIRNAGRNHRFTVSGKLVHNCGYGGSIGALKVMGALQMGVLEEELQPLVTAWRQSNPRIVKLWWDVDKAVMTAVRQKTTTETHGIRFTYQSGMLFITLPSGRNLVYVKPRIGINRFCSDCVTYEGIGGTKKWERIESYGPKFVENIVQATARDILAEAMQRLSARGFEIVMHVHDEVVLEVPIGKSSIDEICQIMAERPTWAKGLLLSADGFECDFYKKD
jgi:DNA polymerase